MVTPSFSSSSSFRSNETPPRHHQQLTTSRRRTRTVLLLQWMSANKVEALFLMGIAFVSFLLITDDQQRMLYARKNVAIEGAASVQIKKKKTTRDFGASDDEADAASFDFDESADGEAEDDDDSSCRYYLAESSMSEKGLGVFTAIDLQEGQTSQSAPDIGIHVVDAASTLSETDDLWAEKDAFMGSFEGKDVQTVCEGFAALFQTVPSTLATSQVLPPPRHPHHNDHAGLHRGRAPGAGAVTQYYGVSSRALRNIRAGSELFIGNGKREHNVSSVVNDTTIRSVEWLEQHGWCMDNIVVRKSTNPLAGRGAFARRSLSAGRLVAPAPLQALPRRALRSNHTHVESLLVNYGFQLAGNSDVLLYPYGPGVNLINHHRTQANVGLQWSTASSSSSSQQSSLLDVPLSQHWDTDAPGRLMLELVTLRDIEKGEELFLDYGSAWQAAWDRHLRTWKPAPNAERYTYPRDLMLKTQRRFHTMQEQKLRPYPTHLTTACQATKLHRQIGKVYKWKEPPRHPWPESVTYCHILKRKKDKSTNTYIYKVSLEFSNVEFNATKSEQERYIDNKVPHSAIVFVERPYMSDIHLANSFRYPLMLPENLVPSAWK